MRDRTYDKDYQALRESHDRLVETAEALTDRINEWLTKPRRTAAVYLYTQDRASIENKIARVRNALEEARKI